MNDRIADMMIRIKNAGLSKKDSVSVPYTKTAESICNVLKEKGYIKDFSTKGKKPENKTLEIELAYENGVPKVQNTERISKFSRRVYSSAKEIKPVKNGFGLLVITTPKGIMSGDDAKKEGVGGELLLKIW